MSDFNGPHGGQDSASPHTFGLNVVGGSRNWNTRYVCRNGSLDHAADKLRSSAIMFKAGLFDYGMKIGRCVPITTIPIHLNRPCLDMTNHPWVPCPPAVHLDTTNVRNPTRAPNVRLLELSL